MVWMLPSHQKAVRDDWWSKTWWQRSSMWCSTGIGPWTDPVLVIHLPFGQYCKTSWTRVSPIRRRHPTVHFAFRSITAEKKSSLARIEACVSHVDSLLVRNKLELNRGNTELLFLNAGHRPRPPREAIQVSSERIMPVSSARNIGVVFDFLHLRNIAKKRDSLSQKDTEILVHASIFSKLYSCNSFLYGLPQSQINRLQAVHNCAARLVISSKKHDHLTPIFKQLHWLPMYSRIKNKILLLTNKPFHWLAPSYITEMLQRYRPSRS